MTPAKIKIKNVLFLYGLITRSEIEKLFEEKKNLKNSGDLALEIDQKQNELSEIKEKLQKRIIEKIISANKEIDDLLFLNADCRLASHSLVGEEISFDIAVFLIDFYVNQTKRRKLHASFKSDKLDKLDQKDLESSINKIKKIILLLYKLSLNSFFYW